MAPLRELPEHRRQDGVVVFVMFRLIPEAKKVLRYAWSVKLIALSFLLSGAEVAVQAAIALGVNPPVRAGLFAVLAGVVSVAAAVARFIVQDKVRQ